MVSIYARRQLRRASTSPGSPRCSGAAPPSSSVLGRCDPPLTMAERIPELVRELKVGDDDAKARAARALVSLARNPGNVVAIVEAGAIEPLVALLGAAAGVELGRRLLLCGRRSRRRGHAPDAAPRARGRREGRGGGRGRRGRVRRRVALRPGVRPARLRGRLRRADEGAPRRRPAPRAGPQAQGAEARLELRRVRADGLPGPAAADRRRLRVGGRGRGGHEQRRDLRRVAGRRLVN